MLVVFKSAPILKRTLKVKHAMLQLYVLKLLKMQTKYLGRQWRKSNMKTMSAIYTKVGYHQLCLCLLLTCSRCVTDSMMTGRLVTMWTPGRGTSKPRSVLSGLLSTGQLGQC